MEPFTLGRDFHKRDVIDVFSSIIWTERYYGDGEVQLVVPPTNDMFAKLPLGIFLGIDKSDEIMILETMNVEEGKLTLNGISLLKWLDNRFVRASNKHADRTWKIEGVPGKLLWDIVYNMCVEGSPYLNGTIDTGIPNPELLAIPGLDLYDYDNFGESIQYGVEFNKAVFTALKELATTHEIGMQIVLREVTDTSYSLGFRSYRGLDRTSAQTVNQPVRFSPQIDSLTDIKELQSIAPLKTQVYVFTGQTLDPVGTMPPGEAHLTGPQYTGFDLRALQVFADDVTALSLGGTDTVPVDPAIVKEVLDNRALDALTDNGFIVTVDGEIIPSSQFKYGVHYNLGDLIETQGNSNITAISRITEYIRAQDEAGERAYPTVEKIASEIIDD